MIERIRALLLPAICVAFLGCANVEPSPSPVPVPAPQPVQTPISPATQPAETKPDANAAPIDVNEPAAQAADTPDSNTPPAGEPHVAVAEPKIEVPVAAVPVPNQVVAQTPPPSSAASFVDRYAAILATYVREDGLVDYGDLRRHRLELKSVLTLLDELDPNVYESWSSQEKLAFWINAYNLKMLDIIARNYPIESSWWLRLTWPPSDIRHIQGIWTDYRFIVMDEEFTLAEVEQRYFRDNADGFDARPGGDPRVWLALNYAAQSGPPLRNRPYGGEGGSGSVEASKRGSGRTEDGPHDSTLQRVNASALPLQTLLDRQLDDQVKRFLGTPQGLQIDRQKMVVRLSALFKPSWRGKEFIARYGTDKKFKSREPATRAVLNFLTNYLSREDVEFLEVENYSLEYLNFDWRLNDTAKGY
ncbi:MAG: DUF547 domain-containing protein [Phycisphaerales bacterium]